jgi:hypothetical protein
MLRNRLRSGKAQSMPRPYSLSCHCGAIELEIDAEPAALEECNCSTCGRFGFVHWKVPAEAVRLVTQKCSIATYLWRDADGGYQFCPTCGTGMMRTGYRDHIAVNARCIKGIDIFTLEVKRYDGRNLMPPGPTM